MQSEASRTTSGQSHRDDVHAGAASPTRGRVALVIATVSVPAFLLAPMAPLGQLVWPPPAMELHPAPAAAHDALFILLSLITAVALGGAVAFLAYGGPAVRGLAGSRPGLAAAMHLAVFWVLGNWWVHDSLHMVIGLNPTGLLALEYGFHVTLMIAGAVLAYGLVELGRRRARVGAAAPRQVTATV